MFWLKDQSVAFSHLPFEIEVQSQNCEKIKELWNLKKIFCLSFIATLIL